MDEKVYWTDVSLNTISRAFLNGSSQETIVSTGLQNPFGLAVDPFGQNIYWTDSVEEVIEVASMNGLYRRVLFKDNLQDPRDIILDVTRGYIKILIISNYFCRLFNYSHCIGSLLTWTSYNLHTYCSNVSVRQQAEDSNVRRKLPSLNRPLDELRTLS